MKNMKFWRTALVATLVLTVMLSVTGGTIAWFTDEVTSAANVIKSGTLDVKVFYGEGNDADTADWENLEETKAALFDYSLWEPGFVATKGVKIVNAGDLALKFQLKFLPNAQSTGAFKLEDVIDVYVSESAVTDRTVLGTNVGTLASLMNTDNAVHGELLAGKDDVVYISLKMQESAGNDYQNLSVGNGFGLSLMATQLTYEDDSFDNQYDKDATYTAEIDAFKAALTNAQAGDTVELNLSHNAYMGKGEMLVAPEGVNIVVNGNGHTIYADDAVHVIGAKRDSDITIKNLTVVGSTTDDAIISQNNGVGEVNIVMENVTVNLSNITGINWPVCFGGNGTATLTNCVITGAGLDSGDYADGNVFFAGAQMDVTVVNSKIDNVMLNGNANASATMKVDADSEIGLVYLEAKDPSVVTGNVDSVKKWFYPVNKDNLSDAVSKAQPGDTVVIPAGTYSFPASALKAGVTLECAEGTVFTGTSSLNIDGATVVGATFANEGGKAVSGTVNGTFKDCTFNGNETLRWCYTEAGEEVVFENCVIETDYRGVHFDGMNGNVTFKNCTINGFNAYSGSGTMTFEGCTFGHDKSTYNGLNIYSNTVLKDCTFEYVSGNTNFIDMEGTDKTLTITNCTATLDGKAADIVDFVGGSKLANNTVIIN